MYKNVIPIYSDKEITICLDLDTMKVYKLNKKDVNQLAYWIGFFAIIILLRCLKGITLHINSPFYTLILTIFLTAISILSGLAIGKNIKRRSLEKSNEIYLTNEMLNNYLVKGSKRLNIEVTITFIILVTSVICTILFIAYNTLLLLLLFVILYICVGILIGNYSIKRFRIYKRGL